MQQFRVIEDLRKSVIEGRKSGTCSAQGEIPLYIVTGASMKSLNIITVNCILERFSTERLKTKPKVISLVGQSAEDTVKNQ